MTQKLDFPTKKDLSDSYTIEFQVFVPSTRAYSKKISREAFNKRVREAASFFTKCFGGSTVDIEQGAYLMKNKTVKEKVAVITVNTNKRLYYKFDKDVRDWLRQKKKSWGQDSMGFVYQGKMIFI